MRDGRPSSTALMVALGVVVLGGSDHGRARLPPGCLQTQLDILRKAGFTIAHHSWLISNPLVLTMVRISQFLIGGGAQIVEGLGYRKTWIEQQVRKAIERGGGATQVLIVGAGYDSLALRLAREFPQVAFVEVDHPATWALKHRALKDLNCPDNLHWAAIDLAKSKLSTELPFKLKTSFIYSTKKPTVAVVEGVTFYLSEQSNIELFQDIDSVTGPNSIVVFDYFSRLAADQQPTTRPTHRKRPDLGPFSWFLFFFLDRLGEPMLWGIHPNELSSFFQQSVPPWKVVATCGNRRVLELPLGIEDVFWSWYSLSLSILLHGASRRALIKTSANAAPPGESSHQELVVLWCSQEPLKSGHLTDHFHALKLPRL